MKRKYYNDYDYGMEHNVDEEQLYREKQHELEQQFRQELIMEWTRLAENTRISGNERRILLEQIRDMERERELNRF